MMEILKVKLKKEHAPNKRVTDADKKKKREPEVVDKGEKVWPARMMVFDDNRERRKKLVLELRCGMNKLVAEKSNADDIISLYRNEMANIVFISAKMLTGEMAEILHNINPYVYIIAIVDENVPGNQADNAIQAVKSA